VSRRPRAGTADAAAGAGPPDGIAPSTAQHAAWVYLLRCADGSLYCGWTVDLERRLEAHANGRGAKYTRSRRPVSLALALQQPDATAARREEARIKSLTRAQKLTLVERAGAAV
jgi:putative endonuclease